jgi:hypothetical protein
MSMEITAIGGIRLGWVVATWPLAQLTATAQALSVGGLLFGTYTFAPDQVVALEDSTSLFSGEIRIVHTNPDYPEDIVFWCFGSPRDLVRRIGGIGFRPQGARTSVPKRNGTPMRWSFIIGWIVVWNALCLLDQSMSKEPRIFIWLAMGLLFLTPIALNRSSQVQSFALKPGRSVSEMRPMLRLLQLIGTVGLVVMFAHHVAS